jgi:uncharacterized protein (DUF1810 family)
MADDPFDLNRFVQAQAFSYERALAEIARGRKTSHWIWYVFPQLAVLGRSPTALHYGIGSLAEAKAYLAHPVLGPRLREIASVALGLDAGSAHDIFGSPDDLKFRSCMTLFDAAAPHEAVFMANLSRYFGGERDPLTLQALAPA